jgi:hypothetical protein
MNIALPYYAGCSQMFSSLSLMWQDHYPIFRNVSIPERQLNLYDVAPT